MRAFWPQRRLVARIRDANLTAPARADHLSGLGGRPAQREAGRFERDEAEYDFGLVEVTDLKYCCLTPATIGTEG